MIKRSQHTLKFITAKKRKLLDDLFVEYQRVVNEFIVLYWDEKLLPSRANAKQWRQVKTWLCGKAVKGAYKQAIQIIKSTQDLFQNMKKVRCLLYYLYLMKKR